MTETDTDALRRAREFAESTGNETLADRLDGRLADKEEAVRTIVELRNLIETSEENGLGDDPAVGALRDQADALAEEHGLIEEPSAAEQLTEDHGVSEAAAERLHEDDRARLAEALESLSWIKSTDGRLDGMARHEAEARRDEIEQLLDHNQMSAEALMQEEAGETTQQFEAALAADRSLDVDADKSDRILAAELRDRRDAIEDDLDDAEHALLALELTEEAERIEDRLERLDATEGV